MVNNWELKDLHSSDITYNPQTLYVHIDGDSIDGRELVPTMTISFMNTTSHFLIVNYNGAIVDKGDEHYEWRIAYTNQTNPKLYMPAGMTTSIGFYVSSGKYIKSLYGATVTLELILENRLGDRYREKIDLIIVFVNYETKRISIAAQNYRINKCQDE